MSDKVLSEKRVSPDALAKLGTQAAGFLISGGVLVIVGVLGSRFRLFGIVMAALMAGAGLCALCSRDREDKKPGLLLAAAGALELVVHFGIPVLKPLAGSILTLGAAGLLALGIWKGIRFLRGLKRLGS
jgi:hypothetical protein